MQITLKNEEIIEAIQQFIINQGIDTSGKEMEVTMIAGRGTNGYTATVDLVTPSMEDDNPVTPTRKKRVAKKEIPSTPDLENSSDDSEGDEETDSGLFGD